MDKKEKDYFVKTTDEETAKYLRQMGFTELPKDGDRWVFLNSVDKANFSTEKLKKVNFSNIACL